jgi:hypothetical protein
MASERQNLVFISYSRNNQDFALELANELRGSGFNIWFDLLDIPTGSRWDDEIERALEQCEIFMVILTPSSTISDNVKDEIGYAIDSDKRILPILLKDANVPLRLRRFQYVDFTDISYNEGIDRAKQLLRKLIDETARSFPKSDSVNAQEPQPNFERSAEPQADAQHLARQRAEAVRKARGKQLERSSQVTPPAPAFERKVPQQKTQTPSSKPFSLFAGITLVALLCMGGGWAIWRYLLFPPPTETSLPPIPTTAVPITVTPSFTPTVTATTEIVPPILPTVTPFAPQAPDQFIIFFFETIIYNRNYELAWSLLSETFRSNNNPNGFEDWRDNTWKPVVAWERPSLTVNNISPTEVIVSSPGIRFKSTIWYTLSDRQYCLTRDESRNTWIIDYKGVCGL